MNDKKVCPLSKITGNISSCDKEQCMFWVVNAVEPDCILRLYYGWSIQSIVREIFEGTEEGDEGMSPVKHKMPSLPDGLGYG